ncbi:Phosphoglycerol transferase MdoB [Sphingomonas gellani]|uniref:Phosphoglycerol transferase MdoB n=1 Tax=Sphingomonas gellani TaxID=1166340 RepID=A0A1H8I8M3_9SPHN|nr:LTA synthase family protein [Sphingomonas gellani]SEN64632.1 Phosphoglycerol transferase MdoB [Sphingomonas gellani]
MAIDAVYLLILLVASLLLDSAVRPRRGLVHGWRGRSWQGLALHLGTMVVLFGLFLAMAGSVPAAGALALGCQAAFVIGSNAKHVMLGESLLFSDLALFAGLFRHPGFYFTALSMGQKAGAAGGAAGLLLAMAWLFVPRLAPHLAGLFLCLGALGCVVLVLRAPALQRLARVPDMPADLLRHGLIATLILYWLRWRATPDPPARPTNRRHAAPGAPELIVVIQCESFADPVELTGDDALALPGLTRTRADAWQWGDLAVSGFGAYTMRTEFGVLFGRGEDALGFRRYDPFLTARGEASHALPAQLSGAGYRTLFVHPHDLRFYGRDRLMPAIGFHRLVGEDGFPPVVAGQGRYVDDRTLGTGLRDLIDAATGPTLIYAVTMENHGPWMKNRVPGLPGGMDAYLHHVRNSDAMLTDLGKHLADSGRSSLLVFFGDHRPSIPGVLEPGPIRHTPYVMLRFAPDGETVSGAGRVDLTPDALHHAILGSAGLG